MMDTNIPESVAFTANALFRIGDVPAGETQVDMRITSGSTVETPWGEDVWREAVVRFERVDGKWEITGWEDKSE